MHYCYFLKQNSLGNFSSFLNPLTHLVKDLTPFYCRLTDKEFHFYKDVYDMFHIYTIFHPMTSLDDTILQ